MVGCDVSQERKTGLGRGRGDSVAGVETRRERRSKASEGCSHSVGHLRSEGWPCAVMLPAWAFRFPAAPQVQEQRRQEDPRSGDVGMERQEPGRDGKNVR